MAKLMATVECSLFVDMRQILCIVVTLERSRTTVREHLSVARMCEIWRVAAKSLSKTTF